MTVTGKLMKPNLKSNAGYAVVIKETSGPSSYSSGGFVVTFGELERIEDAIAVIVDDNTPYKLGVSVSGNEVTITVYELSANTETGAISASELTSGDLSGVTFKVIAFGR